ncbi:MAG: LemA family protein [Roseburia sp.]
MMLYAVIGIPVALVVGYILAYNRLRRLRIKVEEGSAGIDVALEKRFDLLTEQIEAVKKYLSHEYKVMMDVTAMRTNTEQEEKRRQQQEELTEEAIKTIDEQIAKQTKTMEKVKGQLRNQVRASKNANINQKINVLASAHRDLAGVGAGMDALAEQYPVLNSWVSMDYFQRTIWDSEEHLQAARRLYNSNVSLYNQTLVSIPWSIVASICHMEKAEFYEIEEKKRNFSVNFD